MHVQRSHEYDACKNRYNICSVAETFLRSLPLFLVSSLTVRVEQLQPVLNSIARPYPIDFLSGEKANVNIVIIIIVGWVSGDKVSRPTCLNTMILEFWTCLLRGFLKQPKCIQNKDKIGCKWPNLPNRLSLFFINFCCFLDFHSQVHCLFYSSERERERVQYQILTWSFSMNEMKAVRSISMGCPVRS